MVRFHQGASKQIQSDEEVLESIPWDAEPPGLARGIDPNRSSAVGLGDQGASLLICQHWGDLPIETLGPLSSVLVTGIGVVCLHEDPAFDRARCMEALPRLALREGRTRCQKLLGRNLVVTGLERPVHQKGHWKC